MWAAYKKDDWNKEIFPDDMSKDEFLEKIGDILGSSYALFILTAKNVVVDGKERNAPVGIIHETAVLDGAGGRVEPHAVFFPWSSKRNILESILAYVNARRKEAPLIIWSPMEFKDFFIHVARYGILRRMGTLKHSTGDRALFQGVEPKEK